MATSSAGSDQADAADPAAPADNDAATATEELQELDADGFPVGLSKNQKKKLLKQQRVEEHRRAKKAAAKELKAKQKATKKASIERMLADMSEQDKQAWIQQRKENTGARMTAKQEQRAALQKAVEAGQKLVIDLNFDGMMTDNELKSLMQQLSYSYSIATRAKVPCHLHLLGAAGAVKERMQRQISGLEHWCAVVSDQGWQEYFRDRQSDLVYLTADAEDELEALNPDHIYIIGGLVDRNRYKNECYNRAKDAGIATARLPIGKYVKLATSQVITINQVVEILVGYKATGSWQSVLEAVLPVRKVAGGEDKDAAAKHGDNGRDAGKGDGAGASNAGAKRGSRAEGAAAPEAERAAAPGGSGAGAEVAGKGAAVAGADTGVMDAGAAAGNGTAAAGVKRAASDAVGSGEHQVSKRRMIEEGS